MRRLPDAHEPADEWIPVCVIEQSVDMLAQDVCRIRLERGAAADVLHLSFAELGSDQDLELPATAGADADAARAALAAAARAGHFSLIRVVAGGVLDAGECRAIIAAGEAQWLQARAKARAEGRRAAEAAEAAEAQRPSRILAAARAAGLVPGPVGENQWVANCPGAHHSLMLGTRSETFGCGYCKVKGGCEELVAFVARRRATA